MASSVFLSNKCIFRFDFIPRFQLVAHRKTNDTIGLVGRYPYKHLRSIAENLQRNITMAISKEFQKRFIELTSNIEVKSKEKKAEIIGINRSTFSNAYNCIRCIPAAYNAL